MWGTVRPVGCAVSTVNRETRREDGLLYGIQVTAIVKVLDHGDSENKVTRGG